MKNVVERISARLQRSSVSVENPDGFNPPVRQSIHVRRHELQKGPSRNHFVFQQGRVSLCWVKDRHPTGSLR